MFIRLSLLLFSLGHCVLALAGQFNWINLLTAAHIRIPFYLPFLFGHIPAEGSSLGRWYDQKSAAGIAADYLLPAPAIRIKNTALRLSAKKPESEDGNGKRCAMTRPTASIKETPRKDGVKKSRLLEDVSG